MNETCKCGLKPKHILTLVLILGTIALGIVSILREKIVSNFDERINVSAEGKVFAKPDIANISFSIKTEAKKEAVEAIKEGTEKMSAMVEAFKKMSIEEKDIQNTQFNVQPSYSYERETGKRNLEGYELTQAVTVKIRDLDKIGKIIKEASVLGANQIGNINFTIDDREELKAEARSAGIKLAKEKAIKLAEETGIKLDRIINIYENEVSSPVFRNDFAYAMGGAEAKMDMAIPNIETGEMEVKVNVTLIYKVK